MRWAAEIPVEAYDELARMFDTPDSIARGVPLSRSYALADWNVVDVEE